MSDHDDLRAGLATVIRVGRDAERDVLAAFDPVERELPSADGGWSAKDVQAHLSAWKRRTVERLVAIRDGGEEPTEQETDAANAVFHAARAGWSWAEVLADADQTALDLIAEVATAAPETIALDRISGTIMGNGPEHALTHLPPLAARVGQADRVRDLATTIESVLEKGDWPTRPVAYARYNLACFHTLAGRLDEARPLLRLALAEREELRTLAPEDADLIALRDELASLSPD